MPAVEDGVAQRHGGVAHHAEGLEVAVLRVVRQRDEDVAHVGQLAVQLSVGRQRVGLDRVGEQLRAVLLRQLDQAPGRLEIKFIYFTRNPLLKKGEILA